MRANHIPRTTRLKHRINRLKRKLCNTTYKVRGNPYYFCRGCDRTSVQISTDSHGKGCWVKGLENEIAWYEGQLKEEIHVQKPSKLF